MYYIRMHPIQATINQSSTARVQLSRFGSYYGTMPQSVDGRHVYNE
jgi:hypothetical protein